MAGVSCCYCLFIQVDVITACLQIEGNGLVEREPSMVQKREGRTTRVSP